MNKFNIVSTGRTGEKTTHLFELGDMHNSSDLIIAGGRITHPSSNRIIHQLQSVHHGTYDVSTLVPVLETIVERIVDREVSVVNPLNEEAQRTIVELRETIAQNTLTITEHEEVIAEQFTTIMTITELNSIEFPNPIGFSQRVGAVSVAIEPNGNYILTGNYSAGLEVVSITTPVDLTLEYNQNGTIGSMLHNFPGFDRFSQEIVLRASNNDTLTITNLSANRIRISIVYIIDLTEFVVNNASPYPLI